MVAAWTGVIREKPRVAIASTIHCESDGVSASQAREELDLEVVLPLSGAML